MKRQVRRMIGTTILFAILTATIAPVAAALPNSGSIYYKPPTPPNKEGIGGATTGQGHKGGHCPRTDLPLTALVPTNAWGQTVNQYPTFWFYVPYASSADFSADFVLRDHNGNEVSTSVSLPEIPGVVSVQIPLKKSQPLKVNEQYHWFFRVECSKPALEVSGQIQLIKLAPALEQQIRAASPRQQAILYALNSVWYDALTILAELHRDHPHDTTIAADWATLLGQVKLQETAMQPITK